MKLLFHPIFVSLMVGSTNADRMLRVIFNNGISPSEATFCDAHDNLKIEKAFKPIQRVRYLRETPETLTNADAESTDTVLAGTHVDRELWPAYCRNNCAGYAPGTCRSTGCVGYRRKDRRRVQMLTCADQILKLNVILNDVMTKVSSTCAAHMNPANRKTECYDDVIYGVVENFALWKSPPMDTTTLVKDLVSLGPVTDGFTICQKDRISIEAVVNPCVKLVTSTLTGPNGFTVNNTDKKLPYTIFGDSMNVPMGRELPVAGTYTFTAVPDNFEYKKMTITFRVEKC